MPNTMEETLRVLNTQIEEYKKQSQKIEKTYEEFSKKCEPVLEKEDFDLIRKILYKSLAFIEQQINESIAARKEIMEKYNIP